MNDQELGHMVKEALLAQVGGKLLRGAWGLVRHPGRALGMAMGPGFIAYDAAASAHALGKASSKARNIGSELLSDVGPTM